MKKNRKKEKYLVSLPNKKNAKTLSVYICTYVNMYVYNFVCTYICMFLCMCMYVCGIGYI